MWLACCTLAAYLFLRIWRSDGQRCGSLGSAAVSQKTRKAAWNLLGRWSRLSIWLRRPRCSCLYPSLSIATLFCPTFRGFFGGLAPALFHSISSYIHVRFAGKRMYMQSDINHHFGDGLRHGDSGMRCQAMSPCFNMQHSYRHSYNCTNPVNRLTSFTAINLFTNSNNVVTVWARVWPIHWHSSNTYVKFPSDIRPSHPKRKYPKPLNITSWTLKTTI
jgi:hypothetical protein